MQFETVVAAKPASTFERYVALQLQQTSVPLAKISRHSGIRQDTLCKIRSAKRIPTEEQAVLILGALGIDEAVAYLFWVAGQNIPNNSDIVGLFDLARGEIGDLISLIKEHSDVADPRWVKAAFTASRSKFEETVTRYRDRHDDLVVNLARC